MHRVLFYLVFFVLLVLAASFSWLVYIATNNLLAWALAMLVSAWVAGAEAAKWGRYIEPRMSEDEPF
jgi:hypothetical protein